MRTFITLGLAGIPCLALVACNTYSPFTEPIPATPIAPMPLVEATPASSSTETETASSLAIGDTAPSLSVEHWVKGGAIEDFEEGQVYVIEFWATWCGPCIYSMPHLSDIQDEYGDTVKIIGVSSETELQTVTEFLTKTNKNDETLNWDRMRYTVAVDPDRTTNASYMVAAGQRGIPTAFIVDSNSKVAWIGHPTQMDEPLSEVVEGTWDLAAAAAEFERQAAIEKAQDEFWTAFRTASAEEDWDTVISSIDAFVAEYGDNPQLANIKFEVLLTGKNDMTSAYAWAETIAESNWDNANALNTLAWNIVDELPEEYRDLEFAIRIAVRACEITDNENASILDTLARAHWINGDTYKAIAWQQKAVKFSQEGQMADSIRATLEDYQATLANVNSE